jgi:hypothetical protein
MTINFFRVESNRLISGQAVYFGGNAEWTVALIDTATDQSIPNPVMTAIIIIISKRY